MIVLLGVATGSTVVEGKLVGGMLSVTVLIPVLVGSCVSLTEDSIEALHPWTINAKTNQNANMRAFIHHLVDALRIS